MISTNDSTLNKWLDTEGKDEAFTEWKNSEGFKYLNKALVKFNGDEIDDIINEIVNHQVT